MQTNFDELMERFKKWDLYKTSGRGAETIATPEQASVDVYTCFRRNAEAIRGLQEADKDFVAAPWFWGYSGTTKSAGVDRGALDH